MEGFKSTPKMQCFKEGGSVKYKSRHSESKEMEQDIAQDKAVVKKAFKMHDTQSHEGEKTDLSKLKKGGRMKKCGGGNVRKYKAGGSVTGGSDVAKDGGKKTGGADIKTGKKTGGVDIKTGQKTGGSDAAKDGSKTFGLNNAFKKGGAAKKYADGGLTTEMLAGPGSGAISTTEKLRLANRAKNRGMLGPAQQRELDAQEAAAAAAMRGQGAVSDAERGALGKLMGRKKGGKACQ